MGSIDTIYTALIIDTVVLAICSVLLLAFGQLRHSHPATIYQIFHVLVVTVRLLTLTGGASTLFGGEAWGWSPYYLPISYDEIARAALYADLTLILMSLAWIWASINDRRKNGTLPDNSFDQPITLHIKHIWRVAICTFPVGLAAIYLFARLPGIEDLGNLANQRDLSFSGSVLITQTWIGIILVALVYWYGFRWWLVLPLLIYLLIMTYQGYHRFRVLIPLILLLQIYLDRSSRRWPRLRLVGVIVFIALLFPPLKMIGSMLQTGESVEEILNRSADIIQSVFSGDAGSGQMLDQFAAYVALTDESGKLNYGQSYIALIALPIPRQWWPDKPAINDFLYEVSQTYRPVGPTGMAPLLPGEVYLNFGVAGFFIIPPVFAYLLGRYYFRAYRKNFFSLTRLVYLIIACNLLQVYRDGLTSLLFFTLVHMMPMIFIVAAHYFDKEKRYARLGIPLKVRLPPMLEQRGEL